MKRNTIEEAINLHDALKWRKLQKEIKTGKVKIYRVCNQYITNLDPDHGTMMSCGSCGFDMDKHSKYAQIPKDEKLVRESKVFKLRSQKTHRYPTESEEHERPQPYVDRMGTEGFWGSENPFSGMEEER